MYTASNWANVLDGAYVRVLHNNEWKVAYVHGVTTGRSQREMEMHVTFSPNSDEFTRIFFTEDDMSNVDFRVPESCVVAVRINSSVHKLVYFLRTARRSNHRGFNLRNFTLYVDGVHNNVSALGRNGGWNLAQAVLGGERITSENILGRNLYVVRRELPAVGRMVRDYTNHIQMRAVQLGLDYATLLRSLEAYLAVLNDRGEPASVELLTPEIMRALYNPSLVQGAWNVDAPKLMLGAKHVGTVDGSAIKLSQSYDMLAPSLTKLGYQVTYDFV